MDQISAVETFAREAAASLADGTFVRLAISSPVKVADAAGKILGRCIVLKGVPQLSLTFRHATKDVTKNIPARDSEAWLREQLGTHYRSALLGTTKADWQYISKADGQARLISHKATSTKTPARVHDQPKATLLDHSVNDWLRGLGVLDNDGKLRASMADKHRQISHYLEILSHLAKECGWVDSEGRVPRVPDSPIPPEDGDSQSSSLRSKPTLQIADMGCGKGYLTFGAWHYFHRVCKLPVKVIGVETRADLVSATNKLARQINAEGLEFVSGTIESAKLPSVDALIALHACNTATDDAIRRGIELGAKLIVVAPCCHKELRPQLGKPEPLAGVLQHGLMQERMAEWATDGLRALFLEWAGYRTKVMEFVASEHTPKNLMIAAIREREAFADAGAKQRISDLKEFFGIKHHALDCLLH
jgi:SAM-dependent methyltransferase